MFERVRAHAPAPVKAVYRYGRHLLKRLVLVRDGIRYGAVSAVPIGRYVVYSPTRDRRTELLRRTGGTGLQPHLIDLCVSHCREFDTDVFLDIGANVGEFSVSVAEYVRKVVVFEPHSSLVPFLARTLAGHDNAIIAPLAVSDGTRNSVLHFRQNYAGASSLDVGYMSRLNRAKWPGLTRTVGEAPVLSVSIDGAAKLFDIAPGSSVFAKIDVEGHEPAVLAGARATFASSRWWRALIEFNPGSQEARGLGSCEWWETLRSFPGCIVETGGFASDALADLSGSCLPATMPSHGVDVLIGEGKLEQRSRGTPPYGRRRAAAYVDDAEVDLA